MAISEALLSSIIGAAGIATGAGINATAAGIRNRKQWKYWQKQHAINLQDWNMMNAYNSPLSQMRRYERAGLNPNLIYGQQNTTSELNSPPAPQYDSPLLAVGEGFQNAINAAQNRFAQMRQLQIQQDNSDALVKLYAAKQEHEEENAKLTRTRTALEDLKFFAYRDTDFFTSKGIQEKVKLEQYGQQLKNLIIKNDILGLQREFYEKTLQNRILQSGLMTTGMFLSNQGQRLHNTYMGFHNKVERENARFAYSMLSQQYQQEQYRTSMMKENNIQLKESGDFNFLSYPYKLENFNLQNRIALYRLGMIDAATDKMMMDYYKTYNDMKLDTEQAINPFKWLIKKR